VSPSPWRAYDPLRDRAAAHAILRDMLRRGPVPHALSPGDWDWWIFHADPRYPSEAWIRDPGDAGEGNAAIAFVAPEQRVCSVFGADAVDAVELGRERLGSGPWVFGDVSELDTARHDALRRLGFQPAGDVPQPLFTRPTAGGVPDAVLPDGFVIRPLAGEEEHASRAAAARRAFNSAMDPDAHTARYLRFMRSPAYVRDNDLVVVAPDGRIAAFTIVWPDTELSMAQFEPVGTDPDFQQRGLARALISAALTHLETLGITTAHVLTNGENVAAIACYQACGFVQYDAVRNWATPGT
jgi:ribosomal protein S18 acetylase RimI-like enzyme